MENEMTRNSKDWTTAIGSHEFTIEVDYLPEHTSIILTIDNKGFPVHLSELDNLISILQHARREITGNFGTKNTESKE